MSSLAILLVSVCLAAPPAAPKPATPPSSEAEKIARLQRLIEDGERELARIKQQLEDPQSEFQRAQADFRDLDARLNRWTRDVQQLRKDGKKDEADTLEKDLEGLRNKRQLARDRFDLAIQERKTLQEKAATLPDKIDRERKLLERLTGPGQPPTPEKKPEQPEPKVSGAPEKTALTPEKKPEGSNGEKGVRESKKLKEAREAAKLKEEAAEKAHDRLKSISEYADGLKRQIELEQRLLETARKKLALARRTQAELEQEQKKLVERKGRAEEIAAGWEKVNDAARRVDEATADERDINDRLAELHELLARVQARQLAIQKEAKDTDNDLAAAQGRVGKLENPFNPRNLLQWLIDHGGRMLAIVLGMMFFYVLVRTSSSRLVRVIAAGKLNTGREGEDRASTLVGVFRTTASAAILVGGVLMLLDEVGIPIVPLMGGAAVLGLSVAFGAQNLIKDYFTGFMILLEDQYAVNDVVKINTVGGKVEKITLRMTVLRDNSGTAHFIPHGSITTVSNMSHGWSRCNLEIGVAYHEDVDRVLDVLRDLGAEIHADPTFGPLILEAPEVPGVDSLADSAVVVKMLIKTKPTKQWEVKREMLRRIKHRFEQLGIEIPFPSRTVYHRHEGAAEDASRRAA